jgi:GNAT superfamily N-acetyltransferase
MSVNIRPARHGDIEPIAAFTTGTFEWGDYVPQVIGTWIGDPSGGVFVAVNDNDAPIAVGRCTLLTPTEAWMGAARVHPDHRGQGIAGEMAVVLTDWARDQGALVARLMIEEQNESSIRHIAKTAFRKTTTVNRCFRTLGADSPAPSTNGGSRRRSDLVVRSVKASDAEMVAATWSASEPGRAMRGLVADDWAFHRLRTVDVAKAATETRLWDIGGSWAITQEYEDSGEFDILLVDTNEEDAPDVARALLDLAVSHSAEEYKAWVADLSWLIAAFEHTGCDTEPSGIWAASL